MKEALSAVWIILTGLLTHPALAMKLVKEADEAFKRGKAFAKEVDALDPNRLPTLEEIQQLRIKAQATYNDFNDVVEAARALLKK